MERNLFLVVGLLTVYVCNTPAQTSGGPVQVFGGQPDERASTRLLYETDRAIGEFAIDYGRPAWKKEYEDPATFDKMTRGKVWRLGKDFWTTLDTSLPLRIAGREVSGWPLLSRLASFARCSHVEPRLPGFEPDSKFQTRRLRNRKSSNRIQGSDEAGTSCRKCGETHRAFVP